MEVEKKLRPGKTLMEGMKQAITSEVNHAIGTLKNKGDIREVVHETRKSFKKTRALLRLIRPIIEKDTYRELNGFFRDLSRKLSIARDNTILIGVLEELLHKTTNRQTVQGLSEAISSMEKKRLDDEEELFNKNDITLGLIEALERQLPAMESLSLEGDQFDLVQEGIKRVYSRAFEAKETAWEHPSIGIFHELRKRTKYLWHQFEYLEIIWPGYFQFIAHELHKLSDILGEDHDFGVLVGELKTGYLNLSHEETEKMIIDLAEDERGKLENQARPLAERIFLESPGAFAYRLGGYWNTYKKWGVVIDPDH